MQISSNLDDRWRSNLGVLVDPTQLDAAFGLRDDLQRRPADLSPNGVREWVRDNCRKLGTPPSSIARHAGLASSTLNRFLRGGEGNLNADTISKVAQAFAHAAAELTIGGQAPILETWKSAADRQRVPIVAILSSDARTPTLPKPFKYLEFPAGWFEGVALAVVAERTQDLIFVRPFYDQVEPEDGARVLGHFRVGDRLESRVGTFRLTPARDASWLIDDKDRSLDRFLGPLGAFHPENFVSCLVVGTFTST